MSKATKSWLAAAAVTAMTMTAVAGRAAAATDREGGALSGQVVDAVTHDVLDSVRVQVKGSDLRASTSTDGSFFLDKILGDKIALLISRAGYKSREVDVFVTKTPVRWTVALWPAR
jgi:hypothetical protein